MPTKADELDVTLLYEADTGIGHLGIYRKLTDHR